MLTPETARAFEGRFPSLIATVSADGVPNVANVSRVWRLDDATVAVANQLLRKTYANLQQNPYAFLKVIEPERQVHWELSVRLLEEVTQGADYDSIRRDLRRISWIAGTDTAELRSLLTFRVLNVRRCEEEALRPQSAPETYGALLEALEQALQWRRSSYWSVGEAGRLEAAASRGVVGAGVSEAELDLFE